MNESTFLKSTVASDKIILEGNVETSDKISTASATAAASPPAQETRSSSGGGITRCVPNCFNNSRRNKELSFYVIATNPELRKNWLHNISRKNFIPSSSHHACSAHFVRGIKIYMKNIHTIVPKTTKLETSNPINNQNIHGERHRISFSSVVILMKTWKLIVLSRKTKRMVYIK